MRQSVLQYGTVLFFLVLLQSLTMLVRTSISDSNVRAVTYVAQEKRFSVCWDRYSWWHRLEKRLESAPDRTKKPIPHQHSLQVVKIITRWIKQGTKTIRCIHKISLRR
ncbi:hypothetical protein [Symbiopectobacterium purcellii]|uniref:Secreted protein n=1 Tax=Symbiopectobacterium purcellii TaxID=2871826 RepID=A0ABX9AKF9_9ENTR|nr:hypothetical protein [Symbiopectobacterium purcellii]QZN95588.1 hypothetical protein K6K13_20920 [Symbiopectobacterium purcellii]